MSVQLHRRSLLALAVAAVAPGAWSQSAGGTLDQVKQRGSLRVGVTQAPPWYSKDPKTGEWSSGVGVSMGKAMAAALGVKFEPVEVTWGTAIAALQGNKIDIMYMMDATPERAQAVDFPKSPLLYYSLAVLARDDLPVKAWADLDKPTRAHRRAAGQQHGQVPQRARRQGHHPALPRQRRGDRRVPGRSRRRGVPVPSAAAGRAAETGHRQDRGADAGPVAGLERGGAQGATRPSWPASTSRWPTTTRAARRRSGTSSSWSASAWTPRPRRRS